MNKENETLDDNLVDCPAADEKLEPAAETVSRETVEANEAEQPEEYDDLSFDDFFPESNKVALVIPELKKKVFIKVLSPEENASFCHWASNLMKKKLDPSEQATRYSFELVYRTAYNFQGVRLIPKNDVETRQKVTQKAHGRAFDRMFVFSQEINGFSEMVEKERTKKSSG